eukprot:COSAG02_NODE_2725_length_8156_cov_3.067271_1_plen_514_part_00
MRALGALSAVLMELTVLTVLTVLLVGSPDSPVWSEQSPASADGELAAAVESGDVRVARAALQHGARVDGVSGPRYPPLMAAALAGHVGVIRVLMDAGADLSVADQNGYTALDAAAWNGQPKSVQVLLDAAPDMLYHRGADGNNLLHRVCMGGHTVGHEQVVKLLLERGLGAEVATAEEQGTPDEELVTPLFLVAGSGSGKMVELLCAHNSSATAGVDAAGSWVHRTWRRCQDWARWQEFSAYEITAAVVRAVADCKLSHDTLTEVAASAGVAVDWHDMKLSPAQNAERPIGQEIFMRGLQSSTTFSRTTEQDREDSCEAEKSTQRERGIKDWKSDRVQEWYYRAVLPQVPPGWEAAGFAALANLDTSGADLSSLTVQVLTARLEHTRDAISAAGTTPAGDVASLILRKRDEAIENGATVLEWSFRQRSDWVLYGVDETTVLERCHFAYVSSILLEPEAAGSKRFCNVTGADMLVHDMEKLIRYRVDSPLRQTGIRRDVRPDWAQPVALEANQP